MTLLQITSRREASRGIYEFIYDLNPQAVEAVVGVLSLTITALMCGFAIRGLWRFVTWKPAKHLPDPEQFIDKGVYS